MRNTLRSIRNALGLGYAAPQKYWERRYRRLGASVLAPGCIDLDVAANEEDYDVKWAAILAAAKAALPNAPDTVLDAGCGNGVLTERMVAAGWTVTAIDFSPSAIAAAQRRVHGDVRWHCGAIESFSAEEQFDLVLNVDVLHHVVDDVAFRATLATLCRYVAPSGVLVINTHLASGPLPTGHAGSSVPTSSHVRFRSRDEFAAALPDGWGIAAHQSYRLPGEGDTKDLLTIRHA